MKNFSKQKGFTLIELLVVISIIGLLSSVVFASVSSAKEKAIKSVFAQSFIQVGNALEMYKLDTGYYPYENDETFQAFSDVVFSDDGVDYFTIVDGLNSYNSEKPFIPQYIAEIPKPLKIGLSFNGAYNAITYYNQAKIISDGFSENTCGGKKISGYLFLYISYNSGEIPLPEVLKSDGSLREIGYYCISGN